MQLLILVCLISFVLKITGEPEYGTVVPIKDVYDEGEQVTYRCNNGFHYSRFTEPERTCQGNGAWYGAILVCDYKDLLWNETVNGSGADLSKITDGDETTCGKVNIRKENEDHFYVINMHHTVVDYYEDVQILIQFGEIKGTSKETNIRIKIEDFNKTQSYRCKYMKGYAENDLHLYKLSINCATENNVFKFSLNEKFDFSKLPREEALVREICSIRGLVRIEPGCGKPEIPANGSAITITSEIANYTCNTGFELRGTSQRKCSLLDGEKLWSGIAPICVASREKECDTLPIIQNGNLRVLRSEIASLQCNPGYIPGTLNNIAYCNESTTWTWKWSRLDPDSLPHGNECVRTNGSKDTLNIIAYALIIGAVLITILNGCCCLFRCAQKKKNIATLKPLPDDTDQIYENIGERRSFGLRLKQLNRDRSILSTSNTRSTMCENSTYAEIGAIATASSAVRTGPEHFFKNEEPYAQVNKGNLKRSPTPAQKLYDDPYASLKKSTKPHPVDASTVPVQHYAKNDEFYAQVNKSQPFESKPNQEKPTKNNVSFCEPLYNELPGENLS